MNFSEHSTVGCQIHFFPQQNRVLVTRVKVDGAGALGKWRFEMQNIKSNGVDHTRNVYGTFVFVYNHLQKYHQNMGSVKNVCQLFGGQTGKPFLYVRSIFHEDLLQASFFHSLQRHGCINSTRPPTNAKATAT